MLRNLLIFALALAYGSADDYRLPTNFKPIHYDVDLTVPETAFSADNNTFTGWASITFTTTLSTSTIQLHSNPTYTNISSITLNSTVIDSTSYSANSTTAILSIPTTTPLTVDEYYVLNITFVGTINNGTMQGFYKSSYTENNKTEYLLTSHFEATHARDVFPCFDEPAYRATFNLSLTYPTNYTAIANTESTANDSTTYSSSNLVKTTFAITPNMSTYLLAFTISNFTGTEGEALEGTLPQKVWSRQSEVEARIFALNITPKYIDFYNTYTNINYSTSLTKLDQFAIPDFAAGAMENWGLVTYRETALLFYENDTSNVYKDYIARVVAHELAHQWFGNLVTCKWWSDIFLNEGFATFFEYFVSNQIFPEFELDKQFVIKVLQYAFPEDSSTTVKAIRANASTPTEIEAKFSTINYDKAGSVLRMVSHFLGSDVFKAGLQKYLSSYKYQNTEPANLWTSFSITNGSLPVQNLTDVMDSWINNAGFPLVTAVWNSTSNQLQITQERFLYSGSVTNSTEWYVPISWASNTTAFQNTTPVLWLTPSTNLTVNFSSGLDWIVLNNQQTGYYRVNYCSQLWSKLTNALQQSNFSGIIEQNRAQIVDDAFNLARASKLNYTTVFSIVNFLKNDTSYITWYPAFNGFNFVLQRVGLNSAIGQEIAAHILELSESLRASVVMNSTNSSDHIFSLNQQLTNNWACKLGDNSSITIAQQLFESYKQSGTKPDKNLRNVVYCNALRHSTNISQDWAFLWTAFENTTLAMEKMNIITGLGCTTNEAILKTYLEKTLANNSGIRSQDYVSVFASVYSGSPAGVNVALDFLIANFSAIQARYTKVTNIITGIANYFTTESQILKLQAFANTTTLDSVVLATLNSSIESATNSLEWVSLHRSELNSYYGIIEDNSGSNSTTASPNNGTNTNSTTASPSTNSTTQKPNGGFVPRIDIFTLILVSIFNLLFTKM